MGDIFRRFLIEAAVFTCVALATAGLAVAIYGNHAAFLRIFWVLLFINQLVPVARLILRTVDRIRKERR